MALALFDLDNTLLADDSDYLWGRYLARHGLVDGDEYERKNLLYYEQYKAGQLDIDAFLGFSLEPLSRIPIDQLLTLRARFVQQEIRPIIAPGAETLLDQHRQQGDILAIITATNRFVTAPIAALLGVEILLATTPVLRDGAFTGTFHVPPCFQDGKRIQLLRWCDAYRLNLRGSHFYSDSHNDLPLMEKVDHPVAVDPDPSLKALAVQRGWTIISLR